MKTIYEKSLSHFERAQITNSRRQLSIFPNMNVLEVRDARHDMINRIIDTALYDISIYT